MTKNKLLNKSKLISHFNSICHLNSSLPCNITYFQVLRIRVGGAPFFSTILRLQNYKQLCISKSLCLASNKTASTKVPSPQYHASQDFQKPQSLRVFCSLKIYSISFSAWWFSVHIPNTDNIHQWQVLLTFSKSHSQPLPGGFEYTVKSSFLCITFKWNVLNGKHVYSSVHVCIVYV